MNLDVFTVEEENLICIFDINNRAALMAEIRDAIPYFEEPEMREIAKNVLKTLNVLTDEEFAGLVFVPAYYNDDDDDERSV